MKTTIRSLRSLLVEAYEEGNLPQEVQVLRDRLREQLGDKLPAMETSPWYNLLSKSCGSSDPVTSSLSRTVWRKFTNDPSNMIRFCRRVPVKVIAQAMCDVISHELSDPLNGLLRTGVDVVENWCQGIASREEVKAVYLNLRDAYENQAIGMLSAPDESMAEGELSVKDYTKLVLVKQLCDMISRSSIEPGQKENTEDEEFGFAWNLSRLLYNYRLNLSGRATCDIISRRIPNPASVI